MNVDWVKPPRVPWSGSFPDVVLHSPESRVKQHPCYTAAKSGDFGAAFRLVTETCSTAAVRRIKGIIAGRAAILVSAHAYEQQGTNAIPHALAQQLWEATGCEAEPSISQINIVAHTGADGFRASHAKRLLLAPSCPSAPISWSMTSSDKAERWPTFEVTLSIRVVASLALHL